MRLLVALLALVVAGCGSGRISEDDAMSKMQEIERANPQAGEDRR